MNSSLRHLALLAAAFTVHAVLASPAARAVDDAPVAEPPSTANGGSPLAPPAPRDARALGIGRYLPDVQATALARPGQAERSERSWRSGRGPKLTVIALTSVNCPLSRKFGPSLARIEDAFRDRGVRFVFVNVSGTDTDDEMRGQIAELGLDGLHLVDRDGRIVTALRAATTTEVFVIDSASTLVYRGAASDQYGVGFTLPAPRRRFLEDAIDAALSGRRPEIEATSSPGCAIEPPKSPPAAPGPSDLAVTYARDVSRIIAANCVECHREGGVGPFALDSYEAVARRATMIRAVVDEGTMPPWFAAPTHAADGTTLPTPWSNDRSLTSGEKKAIAAWIEAGKPEGDPKDLPLPRVFASTEWTIGTPDAVFELPEPISIKADGFMPYENVLVPTGIAEDRWVKAVQIVPTDPSVVHHVLVFAVDEETAKDPARRRRLGADESSGYWAAYVPGNDSMTLPDGMARRLPANSFLLFQIHYTPNGKATTDQMRLGVVFADEPPRHLVRTAAVVDRRIRIPPGASDHREDAVLPIPADARILAFMPHMHVRGKAFRYELELPGEPKRILLDIPNYDFNWQLRYELKEPLAVPRGALLHGSAWYDNSSDNPANPDPTQTVRWGPQTFDEMMLGYVEYFFVDEDPKRPMAGPEPGNLRARAGVADARTPSFEMLRRKFDGNRDGRIEKTEVAPALHRRFDQLDRDGDGVLTAPDFADRAG